jgi:hypothetical protein
MMMTIDLCWACARAVAQDQKLRKISGKDTKVTCEVCKKRRFGGTYEIMKEGKT